MRQLRQASGITLIDLVMTTAIIGILVVIAYPVYKDYTQTARVKLLRDHIQSIQLLQEDRRSALNTYAEGVWDTAGGITTLREQLGWEPGAAADLVTCVVECDVDGEHAGECAPDSGYTIKAVHVEAPDELVIERIEP